MRGVDAVLPVVVDDLFAEDILADAADHREAGAEARGHHRLVRSLAAETELKRLPGQRFARSRQSRRAER